LSGIDFDLLLRTFDQDPTSGQELNNSDQAETKDIKLDSMMHSYGRAVSKDDGASNFYGAASGFAFLSQTQEMFAKNSDHGDRPAISDLFDAPLPSKLNHKVIDASWLPSRATSARLMNSIFSEVYPLFHFLHEDDYRSKVDRLYELEDAQYTESDRAFLPLFHIVTALGFLYDRDEHESKGCASGIAQA